MSLRCWAIATIAHRSACGSKAKAASVRAPTRCDLPGPVATSPDSVTDCGLSSPWPECCPHHAGPIGPSAIQ